MIDEYNEKTQELERVLNTKRIPTYMIEERAKKQRQQRQQQQQPLISMLDNLPNCKDLKYNNTDSQNNSNEIKKLANTISRELSTVTSRISSASVSGDSTPINTEVDTEFTKKLSTKLENVKNCEYAEDINLIKELLNEILKSIGVYKNSLESLTDSKGLSQDDKVYLETLFSDKLQGKTLSDDQLTKFNELVETHTSLKQLEDQYKNHNKNIQDLNKKVAELATKDDDLKQTEQNIIAKNQEQIDTAQNALLGEIQTLPEKISEVLINFINDPTPVSYTHLTLPTNREV